MTDRHRSLFSTLPPSATARERHARIARLALATLGSIAGAVMMRSWGDDLPRALWIPTVLLVAAAALAHHGAVGSQLVARSVWWANLVLGTLLSMAGNDRERMMLGLALTASTGGALLAMGRLGLDEDEASAFRPVAFRTTLTLGMIMAVADAQALTLFGALTFDEHADASRTQGGLLLFSAAVIIVAIAGLYRLRVWGLLLSAVGALVVGVLALTGAYGLKSPLGVTLALTSAAQILLPIPIVIAIVRRRAPAFVPAPSNLARRAPALVVALMMAASAITVCVIRHSVI